MEIDACCNLLKFVTYYRTELIGFSLRYVFIYEKNTRINVVVWTTDRIGNMLGMFKQKCLVYTIKEF